MKIFVAGGTGAIGRPLIAKLLAKGHALVALTRSPEKAQPLVEQGIEPAIADVFDTDAVNAVVNRAQPEIVIEQLTALPRTYTRESMSAAAAFNTRIRLEGGANVLAAARAAGVRRYLRQWIAFWAVPGPGLADEETPLAFDALTVIQPVSRRPPSALWSLLRADGASGSSHRGVQCHGGANERLQRLFINLVVLMEIDGTPGVAFEAGVEEA